jgi:hypothetical protein
LSDDQNLTKQSGDKAPLYNKRDIAEARFGDRARQELIQKAYNLEQIINSEIFGQEEVAKALRDKLVQYLETFGTRKAEPVALNLIGLPGVGKSAMLSILQNLGLQVIKIDLQQYGDSGSGFFKSSLTEDLILNRATLNEKMPIIVILEELDKIAEIDPKTKSEKTSAAIATINQILSSGESRLNTRLSQMMDNSPLSNTFIISTMNLPPDEISDFSAEVLGQKKSFYDFTIDDLAKFHRWLLSQSASIPKVLSKLFRSNTVSRLAPISILANPLTEKDYKRATRKTMLASIKTGSVGANKLSTRLEITFSDELVDYLNRITLYAPSGVRNTVTNVASLFDQLISFGKRAQDPNNSPISTPRKVDFNYDSQRNVVRIRVTPLKLRSGETRLIESQSFEFEVNYSSVSRQFITPDHLAISVDLSKKTNAKQNRNQDLANDSGELSAKSPYPPLADNPLDSTKVLKKDIRAARFPPLSLKANGLSGFLDSQLYGQKPYTRDIETLMNEYMARPLNATTAPLGIVLAGFPGIGKSEMINLTGKYLKLPVIKINLQKYTANSDKAAEGLIEEIFLALREAGIEPNTKYILLFEELDKVTELDLKGEPVNRPVMAIVKDLLNDGRSEFKMTEKGDTLTTQKIVIDTRTAFIAGTMNFAVDRFNFQANRQLTTIEDTQRAWKRLASSFDDLKKLLGSMFLPETVNRIISKMRVLKPLGQHDYQKAIARQLEVAIKQRFDSKDGFNGALITLTTTPAYRKFLYDESVIPSEGARFATTVSRNIINLDIEGLLKSIPRSSKFASLPLVFSLDYLPTKQQVKGTITVVTRVQGNVNEQSKIEIETKLDYIRNVALNFPSLKVKGKVPAERLHVAAHEFGHAFAAARAGLGFEHIEVASPVYSVSGYVKFRETPLLAKDAIRLIYSQMASRAMERIVLSETPLDRESILEMSVGSIQDVNDATMGLFDVLHKIGLNPFSGTMNRTGKDISQFANFANIPHDITERLGFVLRDIENVVLQDFVAAHDAQWYADKIFKLAQAGEMTEPQFYQLVEMPYTARTKLTLAPESQFFKLFRNKIKNQAAATQTSQAAPAWPTYYQAFLSSIKSRLPNMPEAKVVRAIARQNGQATQIDLQRALKTEMPKTEISAVKKTEGATVYSCKQLFR